MQVTNTTTVQHEYAIVGPLGTGAGGETFEAIDEQEPSGHVGHVVDGTRSYANCSGAAASTIRSRNDEARPLLFSHRDSGEREGSSLTASMGSPKGMGVVER